MTKDVGEIEHAVFRECLKLCGFEKDIELHNVADLPAFTGLGSSSAFTVSLLHALHCFKGEFLNPRQLACEAIHLERHILREHVGCQDQIFAAFGGFNLVEFRTETEIEVKRCHSRRNGWRNSSSTSFWSSPGSSARPPMSSPHSCAR